VQDRAISYIHPDFVLRKGEMHHKRRYANKISLSAYFYGENLTDQEKETARNIIEANADNYDGCVKNIFFYQTSKELENIEL
nr:flavodoxin family protein [Lachnospiraceae bacterium]